MLFLVFYVKDFFCLRYINLLKSVIYNLQRIEFVGRIQFVIIFFFMIVLYVGKWFLIRKVVIGGYIQVLQVSLVGEIFYDISCCSFYYFFWNIGMKVYMKIFFLWVQLFYVVVIFVGQLSCICFLLFCCNIFLEGDYNICNFYSFFGIIGFFKFSLLYLNK